MRLNVPRLSCAISGFFFLLLGEAVAGEHPRSLVNIFPDGEERNVFFMESFC